MGAMTGRRRGPILGAVALAVFAVFPARAASHDTVRGALAAARQSGKPLLLHVVKASKG